MDGALEITNCAVVWNIDSFKTISERYEKSFLTGDRFLVRNVSYMADK